MDPISRRAFIGRTSAVVAAAGVASVVPMQLASASTKTAAAGAAPHGAGAMATATPAGTETVIAHVRDLATGEIAIYSGLEEVTIHDRKLASHLARAMGGR